MKEVIEVIKWQIEMDFPPTMHNYDTWESIDNEKMSTTKLCISLVLH